MKPFKIGTYQLGWRMVELWAQPGETGATFNLCCHQKIATIKCGMNYKDPAEAFACLCHEVWEMAMDELMCCYRPKAFVEHASDTYHFSFDHNQHTEISARASYFIYTCFDDFKKAHAKIRRKVVA